MAISKVKILQDLESNRDNLVERFLAHVEPIVDEHLSNFTGSPLRVPVTVVDGWADMTLGASVEYLLEKLVAKYTTEEMGWKVETDGNVLIFS